MISPIAGPEGVSHGDTFGRLMGVKDTNYGGLPSYIFDMIKRLIYLLEKPLHPKNLKQ